MLNQANKGLVEDIDIFVGQKLPHSSSMGPDNKSSSIIRHLRKQRPFKSILNNMTLNLVATVKKDMRRIQRLIRWLCGPSTVF